MRDEDILEPSDARELIKKKLSIYTDGKTMVLPSGRSVAEVMQQYNLSLDYQGRGSILLTCGNSWEIRVPSERGVDLTNEIIALLMTTSRNTQSQIETDVSDLVKTLRLNDIRYGDMLPSDHPVYVYIVGSSYYDPIKVRSNHNVYVPIQEITTYKASVEVYQYAGMDIYRRDLNLLHLWLRNFIVSKNLPVEYSVEHRHVDHLSDFTTIMNKDSLQDISLILSITFTSSFRGEVAKVVDALHDLVSILPGLYFKTV
jgi:hypothetical protein